MVRYYRQPAQLNFRITLEVNFRSYWPGTGKVPGPFQECNHLYVRYRRLHIFLVDRRSYFFSSTNLAFASFISIPWLIAACLALRLNSDTQESRLPTNTYPALWSWPAAGIYKTAHGLAPSSTNPLFWP